MVIIIIIIIAYGIIILVFVLRKSAHALLSAKANSDHKHHGNDRCGRRKRDHENLGSSCLAARASKPQLRPSHVSAAERRIRNVIYSNYRTGYSVCVDRYVSCSIACALMQSS